MHMDMNIYLLDHSVLFVGIGSLNVNQHGLVVMAVRRCGHQCVGRQAKLNTDCLLVCGVCAFTTRPHTLLLAWDKLCLARCSSHCRGLFSSVATESGRKPLVLAVLVRDVVNVL